MIVHGAIRIYVTIADMTYAIVIVCIAHVTMTYQSADFDGGGLAYRPVRLYLEPNVHIR